MIKTLILIGLLVGFTGCRMTAGTGYSYHRVRTYSPEGILLSEDIKKDKNKLGSGGAFASAEATALDYSRTNFMGGASKTTLGKYTDKPEADAIKAGGDAAGNLINKAIKPAVQ